MMRCFILYQTLFKGFGVSENSNLQFWLSAIIHRFFYKNVLDNILLACVCMFLAQLCPTLCNPTDLQPTRLLCPWSSPGKNTGVGCHSLLQRLFPTQGLNPSLPHCRQVLYHLKPQRSPKQALIKRRCLRACSEVCEMKVGLEAEQIQMQALVPSSRVCVMQKVGPRWSDLIRPHLHPDITGKDDTC